jgi:tRNA G10  N-methylase Trm11
MHCSRRKIFIGDRHSDPVSDKAMREFIAQRRVDVTHLEGEIEDCEDDALAFHKDAKDWFRAKKINARVGEIWCYSSKGIEAHAFNFSVKPDDTISFWEGKSGRQRFLNARVNLVKM